MRVRLAAAALILLALSPAGAAPLPSFVPARPAPLLVDDDEGTIRTIITNQIQAFQRDDGDTAYSFAAPNLKLYFTTPEAFMAMVRNGYQPIYRAQSYSFGELKQADGKFVQSVAIVGPDGASWRAIYTLVRQDDGSLKIVSCYLVKDVTA